MERALTQRSRFIFEPALSLVPDAPGPAKGLLPDDGAGGLVVDVEVAGGVPQRRARPGDRRAVLGEDGPGEGVGRRLIDQGRASCATCVGVDDRP